MFYDHETFKTLSDQELSERAMKLERYMGCTENFQTLELMMFLKESIMFELQSRQELEAMQNKTPWSLDTGEVVTSKIKDDDQGNNR